MSKGANVRIVNPITYELDFATVDGNPNSPTSPYLLNEEGDKKKMVYRTTYSNGVRKREALVEAEQLGFLYDVLKTTYGGTSGFSGYVDGDVARNIGRSSNDEIQLLNLGSSPDDNQVEYVTTSRILSIKMTLGMKMPSRNGELKLNALHAAIDPMLKDDKYQSTAGVESSVTRSLGHKAVAGLSNSPPGVFNEQPGKPLYLVNSGSPEMLLPVSGFHILEDGTMGAASRGVVFVYNSEGDRVTNHNSIYFNSGNDAVFFPSTITQSVATDGTRTIMVGGVSVQKGGFGREPGVALITLGANETLQERLESSAGNDAPVGGCNISGCAWIPISKTANPEFSDTANISVSSTDPKTFYIVPMTKVGKDVATKAYKAHVIDSQEIVFDTVATVSGSEDEKIITAVSNRTLKTRDGNEWVATCLSKKTSTSCDGGECIKYQDLKRRKEDPVYVPSNNAFGEIQLISVNANIPPVRIASHNYRCSSLIVNQDGGLLISGRLTVQELSPEHIEKRIGSNSESEYPSEFLFLDEVAVEANQSMTYADYYSVEPKTFSNESDSQHIGWLTGLSAVEFQDGTFGMMSANKYRAYVTNPNELSYNQASQIHDLANAGIHKLKLGGMDATVVASILTNAQNLNASEVFTNYMEAMRNKPGVYIPGSLYVSSTSPRSTPTPLPQMSPSMTEKSWLDLYQAMLTPNSNGSLDANMPVFDWQMQKVETCKDTHPKTCT